MENDICSIRKSGSRRNFSSFHPLYALPLNLWGKRMEYVNDWSLFCVLFSGWWVSLDAPLEKKLSLQFFGCMQVQHFCAYYYSGISSFLEARWERSVEFGQYESTLIHTQDLIKSSSDLPRSNSLNGQASHVTLLRRNIRKEGLFLTVGQHWQCYMQTNNMLIIGLRNWNKLQSAMLKKTNYWHGKLEILSPSDSQKKKKIRIKKLE